ncbi:MAG: RnfABCDGE type electron transport complex subunit B [Spirochaetales bacterium]|nr:RnfABCDGE type electron transport complex subunit B [Spirochaetales bacterium]
MEIIAAIIVIAVLGLLLGLGLAVADKKLSVEKDEKLVKMEAVMPGANCGGCGYAGCAAYAAAVCSGEAEIGLCSPGGSALSKKMGEIMGVSVSEKERMVAFVHCQGNAEITGQSFAYRGIQDCNAAYLLQAGPNACKEGCLHLGSCMSVCPAGAISRDEKNMISVDPEKCIGCRKCTTVCPTGVIKMIPASAKMVVACNNHEMGAKVKKACQAGCIGCRICQNKFPASGCVVENFLSRIDYSKDTSELEAASQACPQKCFVKR